MGECISVVGLGKLGLCLAACFAKKGFNVIGVDIEEHVVEHVRQPGRFTLVRAGSR
jgi:UDPglucose 6-dehydrogenase